jgi:stress-induced morphogen
MSQRVAQKGNFCYYNIMKIEEMKQRLIQAYPDADANQDIQVFDLTGTSDHWEVSVRSSLFAGLSRIEQHQHVMKAFAPELKTGEVHALSIKTSVKV